jgi:hypothetical protein
MIGRQFLLAQEETNHEEENEFMGDFEGYSEERQEHQAILKTMEQLEEEEEFIKHISLPLRSPKTALVAQPMETSFSQQER